MKVIMPIAGLGSRFTKEGITTPKPLIKILGKPMARWSADSIPFANPEDFIFIVRREHIEQYKVDEELKKMFSPDVKIVVIDYVTDGAACTALLAKEFIEEDEPLIVTDCDHYFENEEYIKLIQNIPEDVKGIIPVFEAEGDKWSFSKFDENKVISQVAEKVKISDHANIGAYYFRHGRDFIKAAEDMIRKNIRVNNEFYVAPIYNQLIENGDKILAAVSEKVYGLGTPEDVKIFEKEHKVEN